MNFGTSEKDGMARFNGGQSAQAAEKRRTQEEQNRIDDEKKKIATRELVSSWMDRLQLISVITTFFASTEAVLLGLTTTDTSFQSGIQQAGNAAFLGALVLHTSAAIVSFLAAFFLVNYRVHEAKKEEAEAEGDTFVETPLDIFEVAVDPTPQHPKVFKGQPKPIATKKVDRPLWSSNPHLAQVGPFRGTQPPTNILGRCHSLSVFLATLGFALAMGGIACFAWARQTQSVRVFTLAWIAICVTLGVGILVVPDIKLDGSGGGPGRVLLMMRKDPV